MLKLTPLFSSSKGNCTYIESDNLRILVDIGVSCKRVVEALNRLNVAPETIQAIFITHEHSDHVSGLKVFLKKYPIPVFATNGTFNGIKEMPKELTHPFTPNCELKMEDLTIFPFSIPHDANEPCGYTFFNKTEKVTVATDLGHINIDLLNIMEKSNTILLESNHDVNMLRTGKYPYQLKQRIIGNFGHLSNATSAKTVEYLIKKGTKNFILAHLSEENNFPDLALETVRSQLKIGNIDLSDISIQVAHP